MRRPLTVIAALALVLAGCDSEAPVAQPPSPSPSPSAVAVATATPSAPAPSAPASRRALAKPSTNPEDCFDGDCVLVLAEPARIRLNAEKLHYSSMRVTAISAKRLSYSVTYPQGGGAQASVGPGLAGSTFGFRGFPAIEVGLTLVDGKPALVLQRGAVT